MARTIRNYLSRMEIFCNGAVTCDLSGPNRTRWENSCAFVPEEFLKFPFGTPELGYFCQYLREDRWIEPQLAISAQLPW